MIPTVCRRMMYPALMVLLCMVVSCRPHSLDGEEDGYHEQMMQEVLQLCQQNRHPMGDRSLYRYYMEKGRLCWLDDLSDTIPVQTLLNVFSKVQEHGLLPEQFHYDELWQEYRALLALPRDSAKHSPERMAALDYRLTESYLFYVRGLRFGFLDPYKLLNTSEKAEPRYEGDEAIHMKVLYDIPIEKCDTVFMDKALEQVEGEFSSFLSGLCPQDDLYQRLMKSVPETVEERRSRVAMMEMLRWRSSAASEGKRHVFVNLASQHLTAYDEEGVPVLNMKICCGSLRHKSPMLQSRITRLDANPYWNVPTSIVRREVIPGYRQDTAYFRKHRMKVYDRAGEERSPHEIEWDEKADKIAYLVRQDNGTENSLGKIIFRFPNKFDVYLHDTPSRSAFGRSNRAVSHGCIRLERPLELLAFLELDTARYARIMKTMQPDEEGNYHLKNFGFSDPVNLVMGYTTVDVGVQGELVYHNDPYGYTMLLIEKMKTVNPD